MKKPLLISSFILATIYSSFCQKIQLERENWSNQPAIHKIDTKYDKESAVILFDKRRVEYIDEAKDELAQYYTVHRLIHINDDRGIENFNKIYLGFNEKADVVDIKARAILPGGKIIELNKNNIKELKEDDAVYKIFAMDGLLKGCEVEYYYTFKRPTNFFGREAVQGAFPVQSSTFQLIAPERLKFDVKTYNGTETPTDTILEKKRFIQSTFKEIPGFEDEKYAFYRANLRRLEYKLSYNEATKKGERLFTWNEMAKRVFNMYTDFTEKDNKKVIELIQQNKWDKLTSETEKIVAVENYLKKTISYNEDVRGEANSIENILKNKIGGANGLMFLYTAIFQNVGVKYQYVLTGDRTRLIVDKQLENWDNFDNALFYFPAEGKFIAPTRPDYRYPFIKPEWGETNGIFLKTTSIGSFTTAIADVKNIDLEDYSKSFQNVESRIEFNKSLDSLDIDAKHLFSGYAAADYRGLFNYANEEQIRNVTKEMIKGINGTDHILFSEVLNKEFENIDKPLILHGKTRSDNLIEKTGNKLLVKIGLAIGPQVEMYQEKPRQQPVDFDFANVQERKIDFVIPYGYTVTNPNDLKLNEVYKENGETTMGFVSTYEIKGNVLSVHIMEEYHRTRYPLSQFEQFKKIINTSSDFNKVVLILEKKS